LCAFHLGAGDDEQTRFAQARAAHFVRGEIGLRRWMEAIRGQRPDVLVYPEIGMDRLTMQLASLRLAPVQVASWGHPETSGLPTIDHFLSAEDLEPSGAQANYVERLVALPHLGCYCERGAVVPESLDPAALGIDADAPLLVCPGTPFKYAPAHDRVLTAIARALGRCQLVFFVHRNRAFSDKLQRRLERSFADAGLDAGRFVVFVPWQSRPAFHGLMRRAHALLDTIGFSGFNTALQAVECGLPLVTREGRFMRGRLASGILKRIGVPELVVADADGYVATAVRLCRDDGYRARLRSRIEAGRDPLFEDKRPIRALEAFLAAAVSRAPPRP
jgi:predicted O-linked N-acetylglucosamine transferase (SPINDLY family)